MPLDNPAAAWLVERQEGETGLWKKDVQDAQANALSQLGD